jgi:hypothetical protein
MSLGQGANLCTAIFQVVLDGQIPSIAEEVGVHSTPLEWRDGHLNFGNGTLTKMSHVNKRLGPGFFPPSLEWPKPWGERMKVPRSYRCSVVSVYIYLCNMTTSNWFFSVLKSVRNCAQN